MVAAATLASTTQAVAHHPGPPQLKQDKLVKVYDKLYRKGAHDPNIQVGRYQLRPPVKWVKVRASYRNIWRQYNSGVILEHRLQYLDANPSPENNKKLARLMYPNQYRALNAIFSGESAWRHNVWNGGKLGYDGGNPGPNALSCGGSNYAYGLGQACPGQKMIVWAEAAGYANPYRIVDSPRMQIRWAVEGYAPAVHGSIEAAARQWTSGGRNGRTW